MFHFFFRNFEYQLVMDLDEETGREFLLFQTLMDGYHGLFDHIGGGTLDVTIMEMGAVDGKGVFEVVSTAGNTKLGGTDMDRLIVEWVVAEFKKKNNVDLSDDSTAMARVLEAGEKAKIELSTSYSTNINLPFLSQNDDGPLDHPPKLNVVPI